MRLQRRPEFQEREKSQEWVGREQRDFAFVGRSGRLPREIAVCKISPRHEIAVLMKPGSGGTFSCDVLQTFMYFPVSMDLCVYRVSNNLCILHHPSYPYLQPLSLHSPIHIYHRSPVIQYHKPSSQ